MIKKGIVMVLASVEVIKPMNDPFSVSVVVPTYNRRMDLDRCLQSISDQKILPRQVIVVDGGSIALDDLISKWNARFSQQKIEFLYIKNQEENSLTIERNMGMTRSTGSLVSFLDDDLVLDKNYYEEIIKTFRQYPGAHGVQGYNQSNHAPQTPAEKLAHGYCRFFQVSSFFSKNGCKMLPSLCVTCPYPDTSEIQTCEWMSGASVYRRSIHEEITWDTSLKKNSWNEDWDFSYRVFKKYPGTLYMNPDAKYWHKGSPIGRNPRIEIIYASEVYDLYLFFKIIDYSPKNFFIFIWSRIGRLMINIALDLSHMSKAGMTNAILRVHAFAYAFVHIRKIRRGNLEFFNTWLMGQ
jgi:GT2 family glycosyltransferase